MSKFQSPHRACSAALCAPRTQRRGAHAALGFTLVELMVAMAIGLLLLGALISLIVSTVTSRSELDRSSRQIENGRYALQIIGDDLESAGFVGNTGWQSWQRQTPTDCPANAAQLNYVSGGTPSMPLAVHVMSTTPSCLNSENVKSGTPMLTITRVSSQPIALANAEATETYVQVSNHGADSADHGNLWPFVAATGKSEDFKLRDKAGNAAPLRKAIQRTYFVSTCNECGSDQIPTLKVAEFTKGRTAVSPLVDGIENVEYDFGVDTNGDGAPDCYVSDPANPAENQISAAACTPVTPAYEWTDPVKNWSNVMAVRIHVLARTTEASAGWTDTRTYALGLVTSAGPFNDHYKRHVYSTVVRLNNPSSLREMP